MGKKVNSGNRARMRYDEVAVLKLIKLANDNDVAVTIPTVARVLEIPIERDREIMVRLTEKGFVAPAEKAA